MIRNVIVNVKELNKKKCEINIRNKRDVSI